MLTKTQEQLAQWEKQYEGINQQIMRFENAELPPCPRCGCDNTANVQVGMIGRTLKIGAATTKVRFIGNGPKPGAFICNQCNTFFDTEVSANKESQPQAPGGFSLSRLEDRSLEAYKSWIDTMFKALGGDESRQMTEEEWVEHWRKFWSKAT